MHRRMDIACVKLARNVRLECYEVSGVHEFPGPFHTLILLVLAMSPVK